MYSFKHLLRNEALDGLELKGILPEEITDEIKQQKGWAPYYCIDIIRNVLLHGALQVIERDNKKIGVFPRHDGSFEKVLYSLGRSMTDVVRVKNSTFP